MGLYDKFCKRFFAVVIIRLTAQSDSRAHLNRSLAAVDGSYGGFAYSTIHDIIIRTQILNFQTVSNRQVIIIVSLSVVYNKGLSTAPVWPCSCLCDLGWCAHISTERCGLTSRTNGMTANKQTKQDLVTWSKVTVLASSLLEFTVVVVVVVVFSH